MNWQCLLALTACLNTQGQTLPGNDALNLSDSCRYVMPRYTVADFTDARSDGWIMSTVLSAQGLRFRVGDTPAQSRANVLSACKELERDFNDDSKWVLPARRGVLWWVNQGGILLEIVGAALIVLAALKNKKSVQVLQDTWDGKALEQLRDVVAGQAITELRGFILLAVGLFMQMIGAFAI